MTTSLRPRAKAGGEHGYTFVHPFNDLEIATGQGSIAMEIVKELPTVDYILVPVGGGGLCTGISTLAKLLNPNIKVIAVEPKGAACLYESKKAGHVVTVPHINTIADGTAVQTPGDKLFPYLMKNVDDVITVDDSELIVSFLDMVENHKMIVENSGLLTVAALKHLNVEEEKDRVHLKRRQHGRDYHGVRRPERPSPERPRLLRIRKASARPGELAKVSALIAELTATSSAGAQPVCHHQPKRRRGA